MTFLKYSFLIPLAVLIAIVPPLPAEDGSSVTPSQKEFWKPYRRILDVYLSPITREGIELNGLDYSRVRKDPDLTKMEEKLKSFSPGKALQSEEERLAFWINAYNFLAIRLVAENYPVASIKDIGSFFTSVWKKDAGIIGGKEYSLGEIEHDILREKFSEPRIHFAIVCASLSCPDLRPEIYLPAELDSQLNTAAASFLQNPAKGLRLEDKELKISKIFDWFDDDFEPNGGVKAFIRKYRPDLKNIGSYDIEYLDYDWSLNDTSPPKD